MNQVLNRYSSAVNSSNLKSTVETTWSDTDVLGAFGLAARREPMGVALARLLSGGGASDVIEVMTQEAFHKARTFGAKVSQVQARDIATAVLSWYRFGTCKPCGGTGYARTKEEMIKGAECKHCGEILGKMSFDTQFRQEWKELARWLKDEVDKCQSEAGQAAMRKIAPKLDF
jgi:hypothetical protein